MAFRSIAVSPARASLFLVATFLAAATRCRAEFNFEVGLRVQERLEEYIATPTKLLAVIAGGQANGALPSPPADEPTRGDHARPTMARVPCVLGTPVQDPAIPVGLPVRSAPVRFDSTGDGVVDSLGFDTTGDGWVDAVHRVDTLQRVDTRQTQHSAAPAIADQEQKRRAGRQFIEVAQVGAGSSLTHHCALLPKWLRRARGSLKGARERARTPSLAFLHVALASPPTSFPQPPAGERAQ